MNGRPNPALSTATDEGVFIEPPQSTSAPTAPSPRIRQTDPFEIIDDVPSVASEPEDPVNQISQVETLRIQSIDGALTMTPPDTPPILHVDSLEIFDKRHKRLLSKLGGYGWRG